MSSVEQLLEELIGAVVIERDQIERVDLTQVDFETLEGLFEAGRKNTAAKRLRSSLEQRLERMIRKNPTRVDYAEKLQAAIDRFNEGTGKSIYEPAA